MLDSHGKYSDSFKLWCRKTEHLTDEQWAHGFEQLELLVSKNMAAGQDNWPPSYAEFVVMANKTVSPDGNNSNAYLTFDDPKHPEHEQFGAKKRIESEKMVSKRKSVGNSELKNLKDMF